MKMLLRLVPLFIFFSLTACTTYPVNVELRGSSTVDLDSYYRSLPVEVYIYQLVDNNKFINASFHELWKEPKTVLGNTLLKQQSIILSPGEEKTLKINRKKDARFIAAIAIFRKPRLRSWGVCKKLPKAIPYVPTKVIFGLVGSKIYLK